jgi:hypothetical protein
MESSGIALVLLEITELKKQLDDIQGQLKLLTRTINFRPQHIRLLKTYKHLLDRQQKRSDPDNRPLKSDQ